MENPYHRQGWSYFQLRRLLADTRLPAMVVDLDILDDNTSRLVEIARRAGKHLRVASKSVRVPALLRRIIERGAPTTRGVMCFAATEAAFLHAEGFDDLLIAYPTVQRADLDLLWELTARGANVTTMIDCAAHVARLGEYWAARQREHGEAAPPLQVAIEIDMAYHPIGDLHLGVHRSPVRRDGDFRELLAAVRRTPELKLQGLMGYEAQIAGMGEASPFKSWMNPAKRLLKQRSTADVARRRAAVARILTEFEQSIAFFNGGGTGSLRSTSRERCITEVSAGSGFLQSHLFDYYPDNANRPAFCFALPVSRRPLPGVLTCHSGGFIASGEIGEDKAPLPFLPAGLETIGPEGFGEVQTPLRVPGDLRVDIGDPLFFRPAKAGEIAEHFTEYLLKEGDAIIGTAKTYRGFGQRFF